MTSGKVRVRFAPSPTGELHIGNARTALYNWLFARKQGGSFILRIEDTDLERSSVLYQKHLLEDLNWLNIDWDEGPGKGGPYGPYLQSQRNEIYHRYLKVLQEEDLVYPCFCSESNLEEARQDMLANRKAPRYSGKCRNLRQEEMNRLIAEGHKPAYRFKVRKGPIAFKDHIRGTMQFDGEMIGDFIVMRSNGQPAYNFAVVIDDHLMGITHIIRGEDHLSNTASQLLLYEAFKFERPEFYHHALILGADHTKLSKRHGAVSIGEFRRKGYLPEVMFNYLSLLGNFLGKGKEICAMDEIIHLFDAEKLGKGGAVFDSDKLNWMNSQYLREYSIDKLEEIIMPVLQKADIADLTDQRRREFSALIQPNINTVEEVNDYLGLISEEKFSLAPDAKKILQEDQSLEIVEGFYQIIKNATESTLKTIKEALKQLSFSTGKKGKDLYLPIRVGITGMAKGPELDVLFNFLNREEILKRLKIVLSNFTAAEDKVQESGHDK
ncbi:MAG: glutamate--tRNA ligase [Syntrophaceae bacterium]|nr:glutamate--tRNA ligase [Syntrophaceae bacterium]